MLQICTYIHIILSYRYGKYVVHIYEQVLHTHPHNHTYYHQYDFFFQVSQHEILFQPILEQLQILIIRIRLLMPVSSFHLLFNLFSIFLKTHQLFILFTDNKIFFAAYHIKRPLNGYVWIIIHNAGIPFTIKYFTSFITYN